MSARCSTVTCLNGNCQGCRNGSRFCNDPRCYPNCPDCEGITEKRCKNMRSSMEWGLIIAITVLVLIAIGLLLWSYFSSRRQNAANEAEDTTGYTNFQSITTTNEQADVGGYTNDGYTNNQFLTTDIPGSTQAPTGEVLPSLPRADLGYPQYTTVSTAEELSVRPSVMDSQIRGDFPN